MNRRRGERILEGGKCGLEIKSFKTGSKADKEEAVLTSCGRFSYVQIIARLNMLQVITGKYHALWLFQKSVRLAQCNVPYYQMKFAEA
jgi:hypothetical protein